MDLRSGHAYWPLKNGLLASYPALASDESCEVAVVGGGISGALIAERLVREGFRVVLLDCRDVGFGSTAASTALLQYEIDTELVDLMDKVGEQNAVAAYRAGLNAIDELESITERLRDDCAFVRRPSLYLASKKADVQRLEAEFECRQKFDFPVEWLDREAIEKDFPFSAPAAIRSEGDAEADAFRLTHRLLQSGHQAGLRVYDRTRVVDVDGDAGHFTLFTDREYIVEAERIVWATGYEAGQRFDPPIGNLNSTYAAISEPMEDFPNWPDRCLIWESARPYFYLRTTPDNRVIIGGGDTEGAEDHERDALVNRKTKTLVKRFEKMFPDSPFEVAYRWAGTFAETEDGLAYIGSPPDYPGEYFCLGYGGNGITMSVLARDIIVDHCLGQENPLAEVFRFGR